MEIKLNLPPDQTLNCSDDLYKVMQEIFVKESEYDRGKEHFWLMGFDHHMHLDFVELIGLGLNNQVLVTPFDVFSCALSHQTDVIAFAHNHPSKLLSPSPADIKVTKRLILSGDLLKIAVVDHLVIDETGYHSMCDKEDVDGLNPFTKDSIFGIPRSMYLSEDM